MNRASSSYFEEVQHFKPESGADSCILSSIPLPSVSSASLSPSSSLALRPSSSPVVHQVTNRTKSPGSPGSNGSGLSSPGPICPLRGLISSGGGGAANEDSKAYPSISAAYWLPAPTPTPYHVPERKLFVGMLSKKYNENDVRHLFSGHGAIEECTVLRDPSGQSKGCAFVTFATKQAAIGAIKSLHQSKTMEGCSAPLVVKFADTQKDKDAKRMQQMQSNLWNIAGINQPITQSVTPMTAPATGHHPNPPQQQTPFLAADAISPASLTLLQQLQAVAQQQQFLQGLGAQTDSTTAAAAAGLLSPLSMQNLVTLAAMTQPSLQAAAAQTPTAMSNAATSLCLLGKTAATSASGTTGSDATLTPYAALPQFGSAATAAFTTTPLPNPTMAQAVAAAAGKQIEGPEGCNLFIYHLPQEFTDTDLASTFLPFGNVVSAKVFIDKQTNLSKCFGFVSFDNAASAQAAIQAMHGFQIGTKRLKVQLKRSKDASKPY
ncbi:CUGBP Elav-like family member 1 isoform X4 [Ochlerotatus camptorhynchus]|uniref:CUGBP Elav-like family member 1 isoform X4 n=1 Tax=Ochlerotatus camptorhynchus TaxID=644619 RepID=UPI0031D56B7A